MPGQNANLRQDAYVRDAMRTLERMRRDVLERLDATRRAWARRERRGGRRCDERSSREALARAMRTRGKTREDGVRGRARRTKRGENILHEYFTRDSRARALGTSTISWMDEDRVAEGETAEMTRETDD